MWWTRNRKGAKRGRRKMKNFSHFYGASVVGLFLFVLERARGWRRKSATPWSRLEEFFSRIPDPTGGGRKWCWWLCKVERCSLSICEWSRWSFGALLGVCWLGRFSANFPPLSVTWQIFESQRRWKEFSHRVRFIPMLTVLLYWISSILVEFFFNQSWPNFCFCWSNFAVSNR